MMTTTSLDPSPEVPIFLRKTYHMVDTCDPTIACWSDDGETFVVKDPNLFEQTIIPQFFKHSKFSSFVRQLNFYSFRKIKYADTIKIDHKLEEETANFWRFRHEHFRRGRPDLLTEIKRMNGQKLNLSAGNKDTNIEIPLAVLEKPSKEVQTLKKKIEEMTKNIDQLTEIVKKVSLKQQEQDSSTHESLQASPDLKRKKTSVLLKEDCAPEQVVSYLPPMGNEGLMIEDPDESSYVPDSMLSNMGMELDDMALPSVPLPEVDMVSLAVRETSNYTEVSDSEFVDQLFTAFNSGEDDDTGSISFPIDATLMPQASSLTSPVETYEEINDRPDPELMRRLGDALMLLPREIQEMIVNRLIASITSTDGLESGVLIDPVPMGIEKKQSPAIASPAFNKVELTPEMQTIQPKQTPLAATTFAALFHYYSQQVEGKCGKNVPKSIPVIPVHA